MVYNEDGTEKKAEVAYTFQNYWFPPEEGQQVQITTGLRRNKVQYPETNLDTIGWVIVTFGVIFLGLAIRLAAADKKENPYLIDHENGGAALLSGLPALETQKVTRLPDGAYSRTCEVDDAYERDTYRITMLSCGGICAFMLLAFGLSKLMLSGTGHMQIPYRMMVSEIKIGDGKGTRYVSYKSVKQAEPEGNKIRLHTRFGTSVVFIPEEDAEVIGGYILQRIQEETGEYSR